MALGIVFKKCLQAILSHGVKDIFGQADIELFKDCLADLGYNITVVEKKNVPKWRDQTVYSKGKLT